MTTRRWAAGVTALLVLAFAASVVAQQTPAVDPWAAVRPLVGEWKGISEGQPGSGTVTRTYEFVLNNRFIHERNVSTYPAQPKNPKGEVHHHWSFISVDRARKALVLRQFHQESFVNQFVQTPTPGEELVFESEALENLPAGWKARERYRFASANEFTETFELAGPGKPFEVYSTNKFTRVK